MTEGATRSVGRSAELVAGLVAAALVVVAQLGLARVLEFVPLGTRAQATGACLASLTILVAGFALGLRAERRRLAQA
ncbi:hypothetical protein L6R52_37230, partial [Myxococcota bacterium]|nr:hypothetical protein [Myxococcota bacterium]